MVLLEAIFLLITLALMPFLTHDEPWSVKFLYIGLCGLLTPIIGIPLYRRLIR